MATTYARELVQTRADETALTARDLDLVMKPNGPALASVLAGAFGTLVLGILTTWAEASESLGETLKFQNRVGTLSGQATIAGVAFVVAWMLMAPVLWKRNLPWAPVLLLAAAMIIGGYVGTFPKFFERFAA